MLHLPLLARGADAGERVDRGLVDVCDLEFRRIELVTGAHAADDRRAGCLTGHDELVFAVTVSTASRQIILLEMESALVPAGKSTRDDGRRSPG